MSTRRSRVPFLSCLIVLVVNSLEFSVGLPLDSDRSNTFTAVADDRSHFGAIGKIPSWKELAERKDASAKEPPASPAGLLRPDKFQFYAYNDRGDTVVRQMTIEEIQALIAGGGAGHVSLEMHEPQKADDVLTGGKKVMDVVQKVQNVLKSALGRPSAPASTSLLMSAPIASGSIPSIPEHANAEWSNILPSILAETAEVETAISDMKKPEADTASNNASFGASETSSGIAPHLKNSTSFVDTQYSEEKPMIPVPVITTEQRPSTRQPDRNETPFFEMLSIIPPETVTSRSTSTSMFTSTPEYSSKKNDEEEQTSATTLKLQVSSTTKMPESEKVQTTVNPIESSEAMSTRTTFEIGNEDAGTTLIAAEKSEEESTSLPTTISWHSTDADTNTTRTIESEISTLSDPERLSTTPPSAKSETEVPTATKIQGFETTLSTELMDSLSNVINQVSDTVPSVSFATTVPMPETRTTNEEHEEEMSTMKTTTRKVVEEAQSDFPMDDMSVGPAKTSSQESTEFLDSTESVSSSEETTATDMSSMENHESMNPITEMTSNEANITSVNLSSSNIPVNETGPLKTQENENINTVEEQTTENLVKNATTTASSSSLNRVAINQLIAAASLTSTELPSVEPLTLPNEMNDFNVSKVASGLIAGFQQVSTDNSVVQTTVEAGPSENESEIRATTMAFERIETKEAPEQSDQAMQPVSTISALTPETDEIGQSVTEQILSSRNETTKPGNTNLSTLSTTEALSIEEESKIGEVEKEDKEEHVVEEKEQLLRETAVDSNSAVERDNSTVMSVTEETKKDESQRNTTTDNVLETSTSNYSETISTESTFETETNAEQLETVSLAPSDQSEGKVQTTMSTLEQDVTESEFSTNASSIMESTEDDMVESSSISQDISTLIPKTEEQTERVNATTILDMPLSSESPKIANSTENLQEVNIEEKTASSISVETQTSSLTPTTTNDQTQETAANSTPATVLVASIKTSTINEDLSTTEANPVRSTPAINEKPVQIRDESVTRKTIESNANEYPVTQSTMPEEAISKKNLTKLKSEESTANETSIISTEGNERKKNGTSALVNESSISHVIRSENPQKAGNAESNNEEGEWTLISHQTSAPFPTKKPSEITKRPTEIKRNSSNFEEQPLHLDIPRPAIGLDATVRNTSVDVVNFSRLCNELAFSFWTAVTKGLNSSRSLVLSPFGMTSLLAMIFLGARGPTSDRMNEVLRLDDVATFNPHLVFQNVTDTVSLARNQGIANAAFVRELFADKSKVRKVMPFYKEQAQQFYEGLVTEVNFATIGDLARRRTNLLIRKQTGGRIKEFARNEPVPLRSPLAAISANVFQTDCGFENATSFGRDGELYFAVSPAVRQRRLIPVPATVWRSNILAGYEPSLDATAVAIGGARRLISTIFVLPGQQGHAAPGDNLERLERRLLRSAFRDGAWNKLLAVLVPRSGIEVQAPKFSHRSIVNATGALKRMGLDELFSGQADFKGINGVGNRLHLADVLQMNLFGICGDESIANGRHHVETYPSVSRNTRHLDEDSARDEDLARPRMYQRRASQTDNSREKPRLKLDRPFLYFIRHNPTGLILHMGRFNPRLLP